MIPDRLLLRLSYVIRRHREDLKVTQEEFADANGINRTHYGAIERGRQNLTVMNLARVASGLERSLSQLFREAERLDLEKALREPARPPRRGRPPGAKSRWS